MNSQECEVRLQLLIVMSLRFLVLVLKHVNAVVVIKVLLIHKQKCVFLL